MEYNYVVQPIIVKNATSMEPFVISVKMDFSKIAIVNALTHVLLNFSQISSKRNV